VSELEQMYREVILDHYRTRGATARSRSGRAGEGQNPLCGDEGTSVRSARTASDWPDRRGRRARVRDLAGGEHSCCRVVKGRKGRGGACRRTSCSRRFGSGTPTAQVRNLGLGGG